MRDGTRDERIAAVAATGAGALSDHRRRHQRRAQCLARGSDADQRAVVMIDSHTFTDRVKKPLWKKFNPLWWFQNDDEQTIDQATWYHPEWPRWRRWLIWNVFRNPLQNFRAYVVGVQDHNYIVYGREPVLTVQRDNIGQSGWQWCVCLLWLPLPFVRSNGKRVPWYLGRPP